MRETLNQKLRENLELNQEINQLRETLNQLNIDLIQYNNIVNKLNENHNINHNEIKKIQIILNVFVKAFIGEERLYKIRNYINLELREILKI